MSVFVSVVFNFLNLYVCLYFCLCLIFVWVCARACACTFGLLIAYAPAQCFIYSPGLADLSRPATAGSPVRRFRPKVDVPGRVGNGVCLKACCCDLIFF